MIVLNSILDFGRLVFQWISWSFSAFKGLAFRFLFGFTSLLLQRASGGSDFNSGGFQRFGSVGFPSVIGSRLSKDWFFLGFSKPRLLTGLVRIWIWFFQWIWMVAFKVVGSQFFWSFKIRPFNKTGGFIFRARRILDCCSGPFWC